MEIGYKYHTFVIRQCLEEQGDSSAHLHIEKTHTIRGLVVVALDEGFLLCKEMVLLTALTDLVVKSCVDSIDALAVADRSSRLLPGPHGYPPPCSEGEVWTKLWTMSEYFIDVRRKSREVETFFEEHEDDVADVDEVGSIFLEEQESCREYAKRSVGLDFG